MEGTCSVEVGLLKKKPCGGNAVTKCGNCEIPLCAKHATSQMSGGKKTMLCAECAAAWKKVGDIPATPAAAPKPAAVPAKPAAVKKEEKKEEPKPPDAGAPLEFTPTKK